MKHNISTSKTTICQTPLFIGADISKSKIDFACHLGSKPVHFTLANNALGMEEMIVHLKKVDIPCHIILEPTGFYSRLIIDSLQKESIPYTRVNPRHARDFARAQGKLSKTDKADAFCLARYGRLFQPKPDIPLSECQKQLQQLQSAQTTFIEQRANLLNAMKAYSIQLITVSFQKAILALTEQIETLEQLIHQLIEQDELIRKKYHLLISVQGIGVKTSVALLSLLPELGTLNRKQIAALAGLAPRERESGQMKGRSCIQGGRALLRRHVFMAAMVACRFNDVLRPAYQALVARGKRKKVDIIAIARKLVCYLNSLFACTFKVDLPTS